MEYEYYGDGSSAAALIALLMAFFAVFSIFAVAAYVVTSIFLMKLFRNAGHKTPGSAWVPVWNTASLFEIGGIRKPWAWVLVLYAGSFVSGLIPVIGSILSFGLIALAVVLTIYLAKGVQAGVGTGGTGGIVLAVLLPIVWIIWMAMASDKAPYNREAAIAEGAAMPMNWFGDSDPYAPFGVGTASPSYQQGYYAQPEQPVRPEAPQTPTAPQGSPWPEQANPPTTSFPPVPPRAPEETEGDGNRTV